MAVDIRNRVKLLVKALQREWRGNFLARLRRLRSREILVLGDSHAGIFLHPVLSDACPGCFFNVIAVEGATISGLENPNSTTRALPVFRRYLRLSRSSVVIVLLGEVDAGFVIWYRSEKYRLPVTDMLEQTIDRFVRFLEQVAATRRVVCISAPLPTIRDGQHAGDVANARRSIRANMRERTRLTLDLNERMRSACDSRGIEYMALDAESLGEDGLVSSHLVNRDASDHHYDAVAYAAMIRGGLESLPID